MNPQLNLSDTQYIIWQTTALSIASALPQAQVGNDGYRPSVWNNPELNGQNSLPELFYITDYFGNNYFFDAIFKVEHTSQRKLTQHPVQTGANITDHSYQIPARLIMDIGVSDLMQAYIQDSDWSKMTTSRSVNAFQQLKKLQDTGQPFDVYTRLFHYQNMVIENMSAPEDYKSLYNLRASIAFQQIITASVAKIKVSADPQVIDVVPKGPQPALGSPDNSGNSNLRNFLTGFGK